MLLVVLTTWLPKVMLEEGVNVTPGAVPVPVSATALVPALDAMLRFPVRVPVVVGVKVTLLSKITASPVRPYCRERL